MALTLEAAYYSGDVVPECSITLEDFEVKGSYLADVYIDGKIDNIDVMLVNDFLNTRLGDYNYFPNADLNLDSVIDSADLAIVTDYVGKNFPAPWLTVSINSPGGTTNPAPGTYPYSYGSSVSVTASAYSHYNFDHWVLDGATVYGNPKTVTMNSDHTLVAYFSLFNNPANTPSPPSGPTTVYRNVWYTYSTSATDPDGDRIRYHLNVTGPGNPYQNTTVWVDSGTPMNWNLLWELTDSPGAYLVQTWVEDEYGALSSMSYLSVNMVNRPPNVPATPSGPTSGIVSGTYTYSTSTIDPDGDYVYYEFDWGDGTTTTTSSYPSGATVYASHIWSLAGTYYVKVRAKDSYGTWSDWSLTLTVTINTHSGGGGGGGGRPNAPTPT